MENYNYGNMESSMSVSSLSFEEDEFDKSDSEDEIRLVDIEKEIMSKKGDESRNISVISTFGKEESEKENVHQKMLNITKLGLTPNRPSQKKVFAIKSQGRKLIPDVVKASAAPVKHFAYRTSQKPNPPSTPSKVTTPAKVKYVAIRSNTNSDKGDTDQSYTIESLDPLTCSNKVSLLQPSKPKAKNVTNVSSSAMDVDLDESCPSQLNSDTSDNPNFNNIEIIDECESEEEMLADQADIEVLEEKHEETESTLQKEELNQPSTALSSPSSKSTSLSDPVDLKSDGTGAVPSAMKSSYKITVFRSIAPKPTTMDTVASQPTSLLKSAQTTPATQPKSSVLLPPSAGTNETVQGAEVNMSGKNVIMHSGSSILPQGNVIAGGSTTQSLNFIVPKDDIIKCKLNNTPLVLSVPPLLTTDGSQVTPVGRNLLMILPQQLPSNLQRSGVVNFIVSNPYFKPNVSVQIPPSPKNAPLILRNNTNTLSNKPATCKPPTPLQKSQVIASTEEVKILNTKEKDGPSWCWYAPKFGKRDLEGFLFKDRLGFSRTETDRVKKCLRKLNIAIYKKQLELDDIASNIIRIKRGLKPIVQAPVAEMSIPKRGGPVSKYTPTSKFSPHVNKRFPHKGFKKNKQEEMAEVADGTNQIKIVSVASLSELNEDSMGHEKEIDSSTVPMDTHSGDDGSSDLYYTKKVVILRNRNPNPYIHRRKTKRIGRLPKIKLKQNKTANTQSSQKPKAPKPIFPSVKKCSVVLHRDEKLEEEIRKKFDLKDRSRRKRKLDLESMGLIKKVRRRNAIDTPLTSEKLKAKSKVDTKSLKVRPHSTVTEESKIKQEAHATTKSTNLKIISENSRHERTAEIVSKSETKSLNTEANSGILSTNKDDLASSSSGSLKMALEKSSDLPLGQQKSTHTGYKKDTGYKKGVFMSYRERQKISALTHTERTFIFALNTIHALEDLRLDDHKPLLILDQFNIKSDNNSSSLNFTFNFDYESMNNYNVVFTRDDDEPLPLFLLKNLKLVYLVRHGHIKVVSRPVLCKYLLEKCNLVKKPIKEIQIEELQSNCDAIMDSNRTRTEGVKLKRGRPKSIRPDTIHTRDEIMHPKHKNISPSTSHITQKTGSKHKVPSKSKPVKSSPKHRTDSLETKFNEIEKNLSMMFEKTKPQVSDISNVTEMSNIDELKNISESTRSSKCISASHSKDGTADLDYLFANSGDENSNLDTGMKDKADDMLGQGDESVLSKQQSLLTLQPTQQQESKQIPAIVDVKDKEGASTTENLEEILISSENESEVKVIDQTEAAEKAKEEVEARSSEKPNVNYSEYSIDEDSQLQENTISTPLTKMDVVYEDDDNNTKSTSELGETTGSNSETIIQTVTTSALPNRETSVLENPGVQSENIDQDIISEFTPQNPVDDGNKCEKQNEDMLTSIDSGVITPAQIETEKSEQFPNLNENANWGENVSDKFKELDIDQFLSSQDKKTSKPSEIDSLSSINKEQIENLSDINKEHSSEKDDTSDNYEILSDTKEKDVDSKIEEAKTDIPSSTCNIVEIFKETASEQQNVSLESDSIIPQEESLVYLMPEKSGDTANTPTETSSDVSMSTLQVTSSNIDDVEDNASKISYTETSFESNVVLNDQVTVNIMNSSNEFELFNNTSDKVADDSTSIASSSLGFGDGAPDPDSSMIILDSRKPADTDLLSPCEIDTDIVMCSDGISKNLPDDYLEK